MTTASTHQSRRPLPRIRGSVSIAQWIAGGCTEPAPAFPLSLYLIDSACVDGLDRLNIVASRLRLLILALTYDSGVAERDDDGVVTGRVCVSIPMPLLTGYSGLKRGRVIDALERLQGTVWRLGAFKMTRFTESHTSTFADTIETTGGVVRVTFDAVVSRRLMRPHGWAYVDIGAVRDAASVHAVGLIPVAAYWLSMASRWQPLKESNGPRTPGRVDGRYSAFSSRQITRDQLLGLALASPTMTERDVTRTVINGGLASLGTAVEVSKRPIGAGYDVIVTAPRKAPEIRQNPGVRGNIARYTLHDTPAIKLRPHDVIAGLGRLGWMTYEDRARALLRIWSVYVHRIGDKATAADFSGMIELMAAGAEIDITRDDVIEAEQARRSRIASLPEAAPKAVPEAGARVWPIDEIDALYRTQPTNEPELEFADDVDGEDWMNIDDREFHVIDGLIDISDDEIPF